uniref:mesoderm induction early response protein 1-like isoform X3 n=1 Tax=Myxine glutinosa TaxID=7769 RepID=UPI00358F0002
MAESTNGNSSPDMMVHDFDDEQTLEEEERIEYMESEKDPTTEINNLEKEGDMPLEDLLNLYGYGSNVPLPNSASEESSDTEELSRRLEASNAEKKKKSVGVRSGERDGQSTAPRRPIHLLGNSLSSSACTWVYHGKVLTKDDEDEEIECFSGEVPRSQHLLTRTLRSRTALEGDKGSLESESDEDYMPTDDWKKEIMVGSMYQAEVPQGLSKYGPIGKAYVGDDQLLWQPSGLSPSKVEAFLREAARPNGTETGLAAIPLGCHLQDSEQALYKLMRCDFDTAKAREQLNSGMQAQRADESAWTEDECRDFENGLRQFGKDFFQIQLNKVRSRTVGECIAFYYMWKKSERHDFFAQQHRLGKKKYNLHPGVTMQAQSTNLWMHPGMVWKRSSSRDYMDRLLDECDGIVPSLSNVACSPQAHLKPEPSPESCEPPAPSPQLPDAQHCVQTIAVTEAVQARSKTDQTPGVYTRESSGNSSTTFDLSPAKRRFHSGSTGVEIQGANGIIEHSLSFDGTLNGRITPPTVETLPDNEGWRWHETVMVSAAGRPSGCGHHVGTISTVGSIASPNGTVSPVARALLPPADIQTES